MANYKNFNQLSQAEKMFFNSIQTKAGQKLLQQFQQQIDSDKVQLAEYRSQLAEIKDVATGAKWMKDRNVETVRKIDGQYVVVKTGKSGVVESITPIQNGMELTAPLRNELKTLDEIDYQMFNDGCLQNTQANKTRESYEVKNMLLGMPLDYTTEYALRTPTDGQLPKVTSRMNAIANEFSKEGRSVANTMANELEVKIDQLAVAVGEYNQPKFNENFQNGSAE